MTTPPVDLAESCAVLANDYVWCHAPLIPKKDYLIELSMTAVIISYYKIKRSQKNRYK